MGSKKHKKSRRIGKKRFLYLCNAINLLDLIIHNNFEDENFCSDAFIYDDEVLTKEILNLKEFTLKFEEKTGLRLRINIKSNEVSYEF